MIKDLRNNKTTLDVGLLIPEIIEINPTELCNRTCHFCPRGQSYPNRNLNMNLDDANILGERIQELGFKGYVHLTGHGEPTLNKQLPKIAEILRSAGVKLKTITNGDHLILGKTDIEKFLNTYDKVEISVYEKEKYEEFEKLTKGFKNTSLRKSWIEDDYNNRAGWPGYRKQIELKQECYYPFYKMYVNWNLDIHFCCHDWADLKIGNIKHESILDIWNSPVMNNYRLSLSKGRRQDIIPCSKCDINGKKQGQDYFDRWVKHNV